MSGRYNFTIEQGSTFSRIITWKDENGDPVVLTEYTARMQIRSSKDSEDMILELSTEAGNERIALGGAAGTITLTIAAADTEDLDFEQAIYDLELISGTNVVRLLEGTVTLSKEVTK